MPERRGVRDLWSAERDPLPAAMVTLMAVTGMVDAVSFVGLGQVFVANMTGNITLLGFSVAGAEDLSAAGHLVSLFAFVGGALLAGRLVHRFDADTVRSWLVGATAVNGAILLTAAWFARGVGSDATFGERWPIIALLAFAMGIRIAWFHRLHVPDITGSVVTVTLTGLITDSPIGGAKPVRPLRRAAAVVSIFTGAAIGAAVLLSFSIAWAIVVAALSAPVVALVHASHPGSKRSLGELDQG